VTPSVLTTAPAPASPFLNPTIEAPPTTPTATPTPTITLTPSSSSSRDHHDSLAAASVMTVTNSALDIDNAAKEIGKNIRENVAKKKVGSRRVC